MELLPDLWRGPCLPRHGFGRCLGLSDQLAAPPYVVPVDRQSFLAGQKFARGPDRQLTQQVVDMPYLHNGRNPDEPGETTRAIQASFRYRSITFGAVCHGYLLRLVRRTMRL